MTTEYENKDPVCGMTVAPDTTITHRHEQDLYRFCSEHCRKKFAAAPAAYLSANRPTADQLSAAMAPVSSTYNAVAYICPMDPEVRQQKPGSCPKCGMALEPEMPLNTAQ